jgi:hypothetical protein
MGFNNLRPSALVTSRCGVPPIGDKSRAGAGGEGWAVGCAYQFQSRSYFTRLFFHPVRDINYHVHQLLVWPI